MNRNHIVSKFVLLGAMVQLLWVTVWSMQYSSATKLTEGTGISAVLLAVQAPVTAFAGFAFKLFIDLWKAENGNKEGNKEDNKDASQ